MKQQYVPAKILMGIVSLTHIVTGLSGVLPPFPIWIAMAFYGATKLDLNPQFEHILQMYGAYMVAVGILAAFATWNPLRNKAIIYGVSILLFIRVIQRLFFFEQANEVFGISAWFYWVQTAIFLAFAVLLILFRPKASELAKGS